MLKWCAYCQEFLEEIAPYEELTISHGMCVSCSVRGLELNDESQTKLENLVRLQKSLYAAGRSGNSETIASLLEESQQLGVKPLDIILGFMNPMLVNIGRLWQLGQMTVREEHIFTQFSEKLLDAIRSNQLSHQKKPTVLLTNANNNYHTFGLKLIQIWLLSEGISAELIVPGLPLHEFITYTKSLNPRFVGISVSDLSQLDEVKAYLNSLKKEYKEAGPQVFIGGYPVKSGQVTEADLDSAILMDDFRSLVTLIKNEQQSVA